MRVTDFKYWGALYLTRKVSGDGSLFYIEEPYSVSFTYRKKSRKLTVPAEFATDLASIPSIVPKWIAQKVASHLEASVVHDYLYKHKQYKKEFGSLDREFSDNIFLSAMEAAGVGWFKRRMMFRAVRMFGWMSY